LRADHWSATLSINLQHPAMLDGSYLLAIFTSFPLPPNWLMYFGSNILKKLLPNFYLSSFLKITSDEVFIFDTLAIFFTCCNETSWSRSYGFTWILLWWQTEFKTRGKKWSTIMISSTLVASQSDEIKAQFPMFWSLQVFF